MPQKSHQVPESWEPPTKALAGGWQQALQDGVLQSHHHLLPEGGPLGRGEGHPASFGGDGRQHP